MNTSSPQNPQNPHPDKPRDHTPGQHTTDRVRDHPLDKAQDHLADICARLDTLRQRLGGTLSNDDMAILNAVVTELQSLAELRNAAVDPDKPSGTAPPPAPASPNPMTTRTQPAAPAATQQRPPPPRG